MNNEFLAALAEQRFAAIVLESDGRYRGKIFRHYEVVEDAIFDDEDVFWPVAGARVRPGKLCLPKAADSAPAPPERSASPDTARAR